MCSFGSATQHPTSLACLLWAMPKHEVELTNGQVEDLMRKARKVVDANFSPSEHLPASIRQFLAPIADATCQGMFSCLCMVTGAMPALSNGASVQLWSQKPTPLACVMLQVAHAQKGKSRLWAVVEEMLDTCDDVVAEMAHDIAERALVDDVADPQTAETQERE